MQFWEGSITAWVQPGMPFGLGPAGEGAQLRRGDLNGGGAIRVKTQMHMSMHVHALICAEKSAFPYASAGFKGMGTMGCLGVAPKFNSRQRRNANRTSLRITTAVFFGSDGEMRRTERRRDRTEAMASAQRAHGTCQPPLQLPCTAQHHGWRWSGGAATPRWRLGPACVPPVARFDARTIDSGAELHRRWRRLFRM